MKKRQFPIISFTILCLILLSVGGVFVCTRILVNQQREFAVDTLYIEKYESVFISMYDISSFSEEDFTAYKGVPTYKLEYHFESADSINDALKAVFSSDNTVTSVCLGLEPLTLYHSEKNSIEKVQKTFEKGLFHYADEHSEVPFDILLPLQPKDYWLTLEEKERQLALTASQQLADILTSRKNISVYYVDKQEGFVDSARANEKMQQLLGTIDSGE